MKNTLDSPLHAAAAGQRMHVLPLIGISFGYFLVLLDTTIVNVAGPAISHDLGGGVSGFQWVVSAYTLVFASLLLTAGALSDQFGAKRVFLTGLVIFGSGSALSVAAPSLSILIGLRALLGVGGALLLSPSLTLLTHAFPDPRARARATGLWASITGVALVAGPVLGGLLVGAFGWRSIFSINVPLALISFVIVLRQIRETPSQAQRRLDLFGQLTSILAVTVLSFALIEGGVLGWHAPLILGAFGVALVCLFLFFVIEARGRAPMLPLHLFANSTLSVGLLAGVVLNFVFSGLLFVLSLFFQQVRGYPALLAGLAFLPLTTVMTINPTFTGRLVNHLGAKIPLTLGFFLATSGVLILVWTDAQTSYFLTLVGLVLMGCGFSLAFPSLLVAVMAVAPKELAGIASGVLNSSRQVGATLGVAVLGVILNGSPTFVEGMHRVLLVAGITLVSGAFLVLVFVRRT